MLLTGIGLIMLLSASFPSAYYETEGSNPMSYFIRQGVFAIMGVAAMLLIGKINYQRFRALAKPLLYLAVILLLLVLIPGNPLAITRNNATRWLGIPVPRCSSSPLRWRSWPSCCTSPTASPRKRI